MSTALKVGTAQISSKKLSNASASKLGVTKTDNSQLITENGKRYANPNADPSLLNAESLAHISSKFGAEALSKLPKGYGASATDNEGTGGTLPNPQQQPLAGLQMPSTDPNQTGQVSYQDAQKALATGGLTGGALAAAQDNLKNKYSTALGAANASGTAAPQDAGEARTGVAQYMPPSAPDTSVADAMISESPGITKLMTGIADLLNPQKQTTTLLQDYQKLYKSSGLDEINQEIIDADTIINGTEDDIRNEVQAAGGLGTDSQIQAMALSRNKSLLKRYNQLVQMKTDATNQLNTMSQLNAQDKQMAQTKVQNQISAMFQMATFQQQTDNNYREALRWMGASALDAATANDPRQRAFAEKILMLPPGGLAAKAQEEKNAQSLDNQLKQAQINNINSEIDARNNPAPKAATQAQVVAQGYANRAQTADKVISELGNKFASPLALGGKTILGLGVPNSLKSSDRQRYEQAQRDFVNSVLRPESGASISESEFASAEKQYFPQAGDSSSVIKQKAQDRQLKIQSLYAQGNTNQPVGAGDVIEYGGTQYHVDANGNMTPL